MKFSFSFLFFLQDIVSCLIYLIHCLLFNIFLSDLFLIVKDVNITSYADVNTLYDSCETIEEVTLSLQSSSKKLFQWVSDN